MSRATGGGCRATETATIGAGGTGYGSVWNGTAGIAPLVLDRRLQRMAAAWQHQHEPDLAR